MLTNYILEEFKKKRNKYNKAVCGLISCQIFYRYVNILQQLSFFF